MKESSRASLKVLLTAVGGVFLLLWFFSQATGLFHYAVGGFATYHVRIEAPKSELSSLWQAEMCAYMSGLENQEEAYTIDLNALIDNGYQRNPAIVVFLAVVDIDLGSEKIQGFLARANRVDGQRVYEYSSFDESSFKLMRGAKPMPGEAGPWDWNSPADFEGVNFHAVLIKYPPFPLSNQGSGQPPLY